MIERWVVYFVFAAWGFTTVLSTTAKSKYEMVLGHASFSIITLLAVIGYIIR